MNVCLQPPVFNASGAAVCHPQRLAARWAGRCAERRVAWPWRRRRFSFSVSYCVGKTLKVMNVCLQCPVYNVLGAAVCRPQRLAARWAGRCAERRVAWPWRRRRFSFSVSYCVGKTLKVVNVCLQCPVFNALGAAVCRPQRLAARWAGRCTERRVTWPWRWSRAFICLSYCACKTLNSVHVCLQCPVFNASGAAACRPQWRLAWPRRTRRAFIFLSYCVRKT